MTKDHLLSRLMELLPLILVLVGSVHRCNGQNGGNFFYYYSPTQRTHVTHGIASAPGQFFNNPFFSHQQAPTPVPPQEQHTNDGPQQEKQSQLGLSFPTMSPQYQSPVLGYHHQPHFQSHVFPTAAPPAHLQYPLMSPTPVSPVYNAFTRFGNQAFGSFPYTSQPSFVSTQPPLGTVSPGTFSFFNNPFQYLHERIIQSTPTPEAPVGTSTSIPPLASSTPAPESDAEVVDAAPIATRRPKISSRFRYVQPVQYNPYSQFGSPYSSDLPYTEQRLYSSPTNPSGYSFSLGGENGSGSTSTVHFSLGPLSNIQQYHKEISNTRRKLQRQRIEEAELPASAPTASPASETPMSHDAPIAEEPVQSSTTTVAPPSSTTTPAPISSTPEPTSSTASAPVSDVRPEAMNSTLEPLLNEPSFRSETIAAPASSAIPDISTKLSDINIPRRLVIRKKVARKRLRLEGLGEDGDAVAQVMPNGIMVRRISSPNRLPIDDNKEYDNSESLKGPVVDPLPELVTPSTTSTTTEKVESMPSEETPAAHDPIDTSMHKENIDFPGQVSHDKSDGTGSTHLQPLNPPNNYEYYEEYEDDSQPQSLNNNADRIMSAVMAPESDHDLPVLPGVSKDDFPTVFKHAEGDNSVETDQGVVINRVSVSQPTIEHSRQNDLPPSTPSTTTTTTTEAVFMKNDPIEEEPPMDSEEPAPPIFQQASSTTEAAMPMSTPASSITSQQGTQDMTDVRGQENEQEEEVTPMPMPPQPDAPMEPYMDSHSSTTTAPEHSVESMMSSTSETVQVRVPQHNEMSTDAPQMVSEGSISSTTESLVSSSSTTEDSAMLPELELSSLSSTEQSHVVASSTNDVSPLSPTTESVPSSTEQSKDVDFPLSSEDHLDDGDHPGEADVESDSAEIGKAQRLALEESLRRIRERQQTSSSTTDSYLAENSPDNEVQNGRRVFSRKPFQISNLPLPTSGSAPRVNVVLEEEEGVDRSQVIEKIQRFRQNARTTTTKRPRRVTRPSPASEGRIPVVVPVDDLLGRQVQVDSYSDSSSTPGPVIEPATTTPPITPSFYPRSRTTQSTTVIPEESSTTEATLTNDMFNPPADMSSTTIATEYFTTTTPGPRMLTKMTENEISSTTPTNDDFSSTTQTDYEQVMRAEPESSTTIRTTSSTDMPMMTTTPSSMTMTTLPPKMATPEIDTSDESEAMTVNDDDIVYEDNVKSAPPKVQVSSTEVPSSSTEVVASSTEAEMSDGPSSSTTTMPPPSSTDAVYTYLTTPEPFSMGTTTVSSTETISSTTMTTTPAGQLIIHEILPTMPPIKQVRFVIGESVEDDQSSSAGVAAQIAPTSDELFNADKAVVRVETNVHVVTNGTSTDNDSASAEVSQEVANQLTNASVESGEGSQRRVRVVVRRQRRLRRPTTEGSPQETGERRRRRRKVLKRHDSH